MGQGGRALYVGNVGVGLQQAAVEGTFGRFGPISRVDMKKGFCFLYFEKDADGDAAIAELNGSQRFGRTLKVEWARGDGAVRQKENGRRAGPSTNLFVVNFDQDTTGEQDLRLYFSECGHIREVLMKDNWAIVEYALLDDAKLAQAKFNGSRFRGRQITVDFAVSTAKRGRDDFNHLRPDETHIRPVREPYPCEPYERYEYNEGRRNYGDGKSGYTDGRWQDTSRFYRNSPSRQTGERGRSPPPPPRGAREREYSPPPPSRIFTDRRISPPPSRAFVDRRISPPPPRSHRDHGMSRLSPSDHLGSRVGTPAVDYRGRSPSPPRRRGREGRSPSPPRRRGREGRSPSPPSKRRRRQGHEVKEQDSNWQSTSHDRRSPSARGWDDPSEGRYSDQHRSQEICRNRGNEGPSWREASNEGQAKHVRDEFPERGE